MFGLNKKKCIYCGIKNNDVQYVKIGRHTKQPTYACRLCAKARGHVRQLGKSNKTVNTIGNVKPAFDKKKFK